MGIGPPGLEQVRNVKTRFLRRPLATILVCAACLSGCNEPEEVQAVPKRADDQISSAELASFLSIVNSRPEQRLPAMSTVMPAAPQWSRNRTLPVNELVREEEKSQVERESIDWLAAHCPQSRFLKCALRREKMTIEQFLGLYVALGDAMSRDSIPADRDLESILIRGRGAIAELKKDQRIFSSLPDDEAYFLREKSGWLAVVDRAARMKLVHPANLTLVRKHRDRLAAVMPDEFQGNPFLEFTMLLDDRGVPFQEPIGQDNDDLLPWSRDRALVESDEGGAGRNP